MNDFNEEINFANELILNERLHFIQNVIQEYGGEDNFYLAYSGGMDSCVLSYMIDEALPGNNIPRVRVNTGIDYTLMNKFVSQQAKKDARIINIYPSVKVIPTLRQYGYPFKSKSHSKHVDIFQRNGVTKDTQGYVFDKHIYRSFDCPECLKYQFTDSFNIRISDKCCWYIKEKTMKDYEKQNKKPYSIIGIMREEGGRRISANCLAFHNKKFKSLQPLAFLSKEFEQWYIQKNNIELCELYYEPYNFKRTGCKGCPFSRQLRNELQVLKNLCPQDYNHAEYLWKPIYDEYRRIGYRLKNEDEEKDL